MAPSFVLGTGANCWSRSLEKGLAGLGGLGLRGNFPIGVRRGDRLQGNFLSYCNFSWPLEKKGKDHSLE